jgi:two-component system, response regulator YesN
MLMKLLIVDDEAVIREGIKRTIERSYPTYRVLLAASPEEAARSLRSCSIDVVLTDILMPGMTGLELMHLSRSRHPHVKWVVISAHSEFAYAQEAIRLGAMDYLLKPIGKEMLVQMISHISQVLQKEADIVKEAEMLKRNLKYLREAVFQRWASGLDIGCINMAEFIESHPSFHLIMVKMESDREVHLEHFIIENILTEFIEREGKGFVTSYDVKSLLGLVTMNNEDVFKSMLEELRVQLKRVLKVPFQVMHSDRINSFNEIPDKVQRMRQEAVTQEFESYSTGNQKIIEVALQYMKAYYNTDLTLENVASVVYLNSGYFSQLFKQKIGCGFKEYVTHLRMEKAKILLLQSQLKLADISECIGYQDVKYFTQVFRKKFNVTPTEYRETQPSRVRG